MLNVAGTSDWDASEPGGRADAGTRVAGTVRLNAAPGMHGRDQARASSTRSVTTHAPTCR